MEIDNLEMEADNFEKLKEQMYRKGFGTEHTAELKEKMDSGVKEFTIEHYATMKNGDEMGYQIEFGRGGEDNYTYLNGFTAGLLKNIDKPGEVKEHHFPAKFLITATEAYRMLKYSLDVAVNKNLYNKDGKQYNTWISIDTNGPKDEYDNYPEKTFHQNYYGGAPFEPRDALVKFQTPIKEVQYNLQLKSLNERLKKAEIVPVLYKDDGEEKTGFVTIDPENAGARLHDGDMTVIESVSLPRKGIKQNQSETTVSPTGQPSDQPNEVKKKPGQQIEWGRKNQPKMKR